MGKKDKGTIRESEAERQLMNISLDRYQQYKQKWQPIQQQAVRVVESMGKAGSMERRRARARTTGAIGADFDEAAAQVEGSLLDKEIGTGSSNFRVKQATMGTERAKAQGIGGAGAEDTIDKEYISSLSGLMAIGRDQSEQAMRTTALSANTTANNNRTAAGLSAAKRARNYAVAGQAIGIGATMAGGFGGPTFTGGNGSGTEPMGDGAAPGEAVGRIGY
jgi:hypothetical protein